MIFITGDTHISLDIHKLSSSNFLSSNLTKKDYVIIAGDFGGIWYGNNRDEYWLEWLDDKLFTTLFIDGNHENFNLLDNYPVTKWNGGKIHKIKDSIYHLMRGQVFSIDNNIIFTFGGAESYDKSRRKLNISWWPNEMPNDKEFSEGIENLNKVNWKVDYIITHTCSGYEFDELRKYSIGLDKKYENDPLEQYFNKLEDKLEFDHWYFGHYHDDGRIDDKHTVIYNSIIKLGD